MPLCCASLLYCKVALQICMLTIHSLSMHLRLPSRPAVAPRPKRAQRSRCAPPAGVPCPHRPLPATTIQLLAARKIFYPEDVEGWNKLIGRITQGRASCMCLCWRRSQPVGPRHDTSCSLFPGAYNQVPKPRAVQVAHARTAAGRAAVPRLPPPAGQTAVALAMAAREAAAAALVVVLGSEAAGAAAALVVV